MGVKKRVLSGGGLVSIGPCSPVQQRGGLVQMSSDSKKRASVSNHFAPPQIAFGVIFFGLKMLPQGMKKAITDHPKKVANLIDLVNLPSTLREFMGQSQSSQLNCFRYVWSYIKLNNLQDPSDKNIVNCDQKLKNILLGKSKVELTELPVLIRLHFPKQPK